MVGGVVLMGIYLVLLPVSVAMILHGVTQVAANGYRSVLHYRHTPWRIMPVYIIGAIIATAMFFFFTIVAEKWLIFIVMGSTPWLALMLPTRWVAKYLNIQKLPVALCSGIIVTGTQLLSGTSGPILDVFYQKSNMNRYQIIAGKAFTQTIGHLLKLAYYLNITFIEEPRLTLPWWIYFVAIGVATVGTKIGALILERINEQQFHKVSKLVILIISFIFIIQGIIILLQSY